MWLSSPAFLPQDVSKSKGDYPSLMEYEARGSSTGGFGCGFSGEVVRPSLHALMNIMRIGVGCTIRNNNKLLLNYTSKLDFVLKKSLRKATQTS